MKKLLLLAILFAGLSITAMAQPRAIGARLGGDVDFSYQHQLGDNMLDCTAGMFIGYNYWGVGVAVMYDWIFPINSWQKRGTWNWYVGPGGGVGFVPVIGFGIPVSLSVGGQIGVEYQFEIPLNLSLDYRPMVNVLGFGNGTWGSFYGIALGVRYRF